MQSQFQAAINQLCSEKNLPKEEVLESIKAALKTAYKKDYGNREQEIEVELSESGENATIYQVFTVVETVEDADLEMTPKEATKYEKAVKVGDEIRVDVTPMEFGRIAAQSAKQVILQKLQESERKIMYDNFKDRENELINAQVHRVQNGHVFIDLGKIIIELPRDAQIKGERYFAGQRLKLYLDKVIKTTKGPKLLISRTHPKLVAKLFELEIPEVHQGLVKIVKIARDAGLRTKMVVESTDQKIDPVGSCVGQKGVRIKSIMEELSGERIDIIQNPSSQQKLIRESLSPAEIKFIDLDEDKSILNIYVTDDQRPLAIGKRGQNVRLASKLLELEINIKNFEDLDPAKQKEVLEKEESTSNENTKEENMPDETPDVEDVHELGLDEETMDALVEANLTQIIQLKGLSVKDLSTIEGISKEAAEIIFEKLSQ
ncbi:transcription termination/antitermination protein NusA [bacterium]|jgi:transcription termination/antitermination protein NusA|nr:transcription termination/antitermination protein NusA [bacterium]MBT6293349.1 transcription termination/antitermination protein NusA [bacterium]